MCRPYADIAAAALGAAVLSTSLLLSGCGSTPSAKDSAMPAVPRDAVSADAAAPMEQGSTSGAQKPVGNAEAPVPPEAAQQFNNAVAMVGSGNNAGAESAFRSLAAAYPTYAAPLVNLAILQTKAGQLDAAEQSLKDATARNANSATAYNQLGIVYRRLGRFAEADEAYKHALAVDESYATAWLNLGVLCDLYLQQPERALEAYEKYLSLAATPDAKVSGWVTELKARLGNGRSARAE
jgi:tetratricopeptide (TPR) repeat protein